MAKSFKLTVGSETITDAQAITIENRRPENNISSLNLTVNDWQSWNYSDVFDTHTQIDLEIKCRNLDSYNKTFSGLIHAVKPKMTDTGEVLQVEAWGWGIALSKTHCNQDMGAAVSSALDVLPQ